MGRYDWDYYRHKYVVGEFTLAELAQQPGAPSLGSLKRRSTEEGWPAKRQEHRDQVATRARDVATVTEGEVAGRHAKIARALQDKALRRLRDLPVESLSPGQVLAYLREATTIEREALGIDTSRDSHADELDAIAEALRNPVTPDTLN